MRKLLSIIIITLLFVIGAPWAIAQSSAMNQDSSTNVNASDSSDTYTNINLLFVQTASNAVLREMQNNPGHYLLILKDINPYITYFSQRPKRIGGIVPVENFVKAWNIGPNNFADNNPNGVLIPGTIDGVLNKGEQTNLITLSNPNYYPAQNMLTYVVKPVLSDRFVFQEIKYEYVTLIIG